jgi:hypothetical protein
LFAPISGADHTNGIASQGEPHGEHAMAIMADGLEPRFVGAVCFVRDNHALRVLENFPHGGKVDAVLGEVGRLLVWIEFQPHAHNVCLVASLVK